MAQPVWVLSVDLQTKTATFQSGMADAAKSARGAFTDIKSGASEMGGHISTNMFASRHAIMAVTESLGVQMPRAITALLVHVGPLGAALEAAFPFAAIALGAVLLIEHMEALKEAGIKLTEDQVRFGTAVQTAFNALDQKLTSAQIKADELRNDHLGALHLQLKLIDEQSMEELVHSFGEVAKAADVVFADLKSHWYSFSAGSTGAKNALDEFQTKYESLLRQGKDGEASDLLRGTRESAERVLAAQQMSASMKGKRGTDTDEGWAAELAYRKAGAELQKARITDSKEDLKIQETLVGALRAQSDFEAKVAALKGQDKSNAAASTGKERSALASEGAREAAEHSRKMGELQIQIEKEQAEAALSMKESSIAERLAADTRLADKEYKVQLAGNAALISALDKGGKDYNNQLKGLHEKAEELTLQHAVTMAGLTAKSQVAQYRLDLQNLEESEREKIEATDKGSAQRLAAIDAALKEEEGKNLQNTESYRSLLKERVEAEREAAAEASKLAAEAGKEAAENAEKTGSIALASQHEMLELANTMRRVSMQQQADQDIAFANAEFNLKKESMAQEAAALDKGAKEYQNKLKAAQDAEKQLEQKHADDVAAIRAKAQAKQQSDENSAMASMERNFASGFMQVLSGHRSFSAMMAASAQQMTSNLISAGIAAASHLDDDKLQQAKDAARWGFNWGAKYGGQLAPVLAPTMAATFFSGVMAFNAGTDHVPGVGMGDTVPAMLTPGEGVVPGGVMDNLRSMARSGNMGGGPHYHMHAKYAPQIQAIDGTGVEKMLDDHADKFHKHVEKTLRKMNR